MKIFKPLILLFFLFFSSVAVADKFLIPTNGNKNGKKDEENTNSGRLRRHFQSPIEIWLDTDTMTISLDYDGEDEGCVYLYNSYGAVVDFLPSINGELTIPAQGSYLLYICSESWEASADIEI
ncbi:MAG: hypothetical protein K2H61_08625 [Muribaculaceae bacterium]|nr:hypothetical protein [Muribaculaceae bacterium]